MHQVLCNSYVPDQKGCGEKQGNLLYFIQFLIHAIIDPKVNFRAGPTLAPVTSLITEYFAEPLPMAVDSGLLAQLVEGWIRRVLRYGALYGLITIRLYVLKEIFANQKGKP